VTHNIFWIFIQDIPDIEGDKAHGIQSFSTSLGQKKVFFFFNKTYELS